MKIKVTYVILSVIFLILTLIRGFGLAYEIGTGSINHMTAAGITVNKSIASAGSIGTTTAHWSTGWPGQRYTFFANGLYWVWYSDGKDMVFTTSANGVDWSSATRVRACKAGYQFSVAFDGTYFHYVFTPTELDAYNGIYYRMGLANSDGTITWQVTEQKAWDIDSHHLCTDPTIAVDSNGYPWIATGYSQYAVALFDTYGYVLKSSTKNGTWTNETTLFTSPYQFSTARYNTYPHLPSAWAFVVPLTKGKVYVGIQTNGNYVTSGAEKNMKGRLWDGSVWGSEETPVTSDYIGSACVSTVAIGDNIHMTYGTADTHYYVNRIYGSNWSSPISVVSYKGQGCLSVDNTGVLYFFWEDSPSANHVYYKRCINGTWDASATDWFTSSETLFENSAHPICSDKAYKNNIIFLYPTKTSSNYNMHVAVIKTAYFSIIWFFGVLFLGVLFAILALRRKTYKATHQNCPDCGRQ
jgi:hypothetical protein